MEQVLLPHVGLSFHHDILLTKYSCELTLIPVSLVLIPFLNYHTDGDNDDAL
jgi:hypothetical protein